MNAPITPNQRVLMEDISLEDKYTLERGRAFITGTQALIRLPMLQRERDVKAGLNTAGYITGYRGSPLDLGRYDGDEGEKTSGRPSRQISPGYQ